MNVITLLSLIESFDFRGVSFVSIRNYTSDQSENTELQNTLINVGTSYENMKKEDLITLQNANPAELVTENFGQALIEQAIKEKIESIVNPSKRRSQGQKEAYIPLNEQKTLLYSKESKCVSIRGEVVSKRVVVEGEFKETNSKPITLAKRHIEKALKLRTAKIRTYKIDNILASVRVNGNEIEIG